MWCKEHQAAPPFLICIIGPTTSYIAREGWRKDIDQDQITTYGTFDAPKAELKKAAARLTPKIYTALTLQFATLPHPVRIRPITTVAVGSTSAGQTVHDFRMHTSATLSVSTNISSADIDTRTGNAVQVIDSLEVRAAEFFFNGEVEQDELRRFLNYFISIEIITHRTFKRTNESSTTVLSQGLPPRISDQGSQGLQRQYANLKALADRFVWCAISAWSNISDDEVIEFKRLKKIRDGIAHGRIAAVAFEDVRAVRVLSLQVLQASSRDA